jgi:hypothetical protein
MKSITKIGAQGDLLLIRVDMPPVGEYVAPADGVYV